MSSSAFKLVWFGDDVRPDYLARTCANDTFRIMDIANADWAVLFSPGATISAESGESATTIGAWVTPELALSFTGSTQNRAAVVELSYEPEDAGPPRGLVISQARLDKLNEKQIFLRACEVVDVVTP